MTRLGVIVLCAAAWACSWTDGADGGMDQTIEFTYGRHGGLCPTPDGGGEICRFTVTVRDDGGWDAVGVPSPGRATGSTRLGAASELAAVLEAGWEALTAQPFSGVCPTAYDGSEFVYTVRRTPSDPSEVVENARVRELRSCSYDLSDPLASAVLDRLDGLWSELGLPR